MQESEALHVGLVRQRRGLLAASLALLFYESAGLVVRKISLLGNTVDVTNPSRAGIFLWVAWAYFFLRYYQFLRDLPEKGIATAYCAQLDKLATRLAVKRFVASYEPNPDAPGITGTSQLSLETSESSTLLATIGRRRSTSRFDIAGVTCEPLSDRTIGGLSSTGRSFVRARSRLRSTFW